MANPPVDLFLAIMRLQVDRVEALLASKKYDVNKPIERTDSYPNPDLPINILVTASTGMLSKDDPSLGLKILDLLLEAGADINRTTPHRKSAISEVAEGYPPTNFEVMKKFLLAGADPNNRSRDIDDTALMTSFWRGDNAISIILLLLAFGADPTLTNGRGENAITKAEIALQSYLRAGGGRAYEIRMAEASGKAPPSDKTQIYQDIITALRLPRARHEELRPIIARAVAGGYLTEDQATFLREKLFAHDRRRHAIEGWRRAANAPPTYGSVAAGAGATPPPPLSSPASPNPFASAPNLNNSFRPIKPVNAKKGCTNSSCVISRRGGRRKKHNTRRRRVRN